MVNRLVENDGLVEALQHALHSGEVGLSLVPPLVKRVIEEERWHERYVRVIREEAHFDRFVEFVEADPPGGLGADLPLVERLCADDPEALRLIREATVNPKGKHHVRNTNMKPANTDDASYVIARLHDDRPDLYQEVVAKRLSPHAAAKQAGYRKPYASVRTDDPDKVAAFLAKHFDPAAICTIANLAIHLREADEDDR